MRYLITLILLAHCFSAPAHAAIIRLQNDDRISGDIISEKGGKVMLATEAMGDITIDAGLVVGIERDDRPAAETEPAETPKIEWKREASAGYNATWGNVDIKEYVAGLLINRRHLDRNEITVKGDLFISESNEETETQKWDLMGRYAFSFGRSKKWFNFYKMEYGHDRFANVSYRLVPSAGIGYWLLDAPKYKLMAETGIGWEHTEYRDSDKDATDDIVLTPHGHAEASPFENITLTHDFYAYPALDFKTYRLKFDSSVNLGINDIFSLKLALINDYNSDPPDDTEKFDHRLQSSLVAAF